MCARVSDKCLVISQKCTTFAVKWKRSEYMEHKTTQKMKQLFLTLSLALGSLLAEAQTDLLPRVAPEQTGVRSEQVVAFFDSLMAFPETEIHSVIVMRHGKVIGEIHPAPFKAEYGHTLFSCSKTFTSAAVGIAIGEHRLKLTDRLATFFPEYLPKDVGEWLSDITIEDLLTMRSGFVAFDKVRSEHLDWIRTYLNHPMNAKPGTKFQYDSLDTYLLSAIIQKVTGVTLLEYLKPRLFEPLRIDRVKWEVSPEGVNTGGWGLYLQSESLAKFGQLLLQQGAWEGRQLIPAEWVKAMMAPHVEDFYGYQMWMCEWPEAARADGAYGQYIIVNPRQDMVVVVTQCLKGNGKKERSLVKDVLFPGIVPSSTGKSLTPGKAYNRLKKKQSAYTLPFLDGKKSSRQMGAHLNKVYRLDRNPLGWKQITFLAPQQMEVVDSVGRKGIIEMGFRQWKTSPIGFYPQNPRGTTLNCFSTLSFPFLASSCYAWQGDELVIKTHFVDWVTAIELRLRFEGDRLLLQLSENYHRKTVSFQGGLR